MNENSKTLALWIIALSLAGHLVVYTVVNRYTYQDLSGARTDNWTGERYKSLARLAGKP